eukprot:7205310-Alexandrium_andersonii.AAC.1
MVDKQPSQSSEASQQSSLLRKESNSEGFADGVPRTQTTLFMQGASRGIRTCAQRHVATKLP